MPSFSRISEARLLTAHPDLQELFKEVIKELDFSVLYGHRDEDDQAEAFRTGASTKRWPDSKHNQVPSLAVDVAPFPVDWNDLARFARLAGYVERVAWEKAIPIRWGGDWDQDGWTKDERLVDMPHFELMKEVILTNLNSPSVVSEGSEVNL